ncbi:MAG: VacJ family lipoprotein [Pseudomonadales bacterium]
MQRTRALAIIGLVLVSGCASLEGPQYGVFDPYERVNRAIYAASDWIDRKALTPVARGYQKITPGWFRGGVENFFSNLREINSAVNGLLQGKPASAGTDLARIAINSTVGIGGLVDVAGRNGLVHQEEDLGQTLAVAGITRSRYIYLPVIGPSAIRDAPAAVVNSALPRLLLGSVYTWWVGLLDVISSRAEVLTATDVRDASALDPYAFTREAYYQRRKFLIFDGDPPMDDFFSDDFDEFDDEP